MFSAVNLRIMIPGCRKFLSVSLRWNGRIMQESTIARGTKGLKRQQENQQ